MIILKYISYDGLSVEEPWRQDHDPSPEMSRLVSIPANYSVRGGDMKDMPVSHLLYRTYRYEEVLRDPQTRNEIWYYKECTHDNERH